VSSLIHRIISLIYSHDPTFHVYRYLRAACIIEHGKILILHLCKDSVQYTIMSVMYHKDMSSFVSSLTGLGNDMRYLF
jgi:hypothetical protein